MRSSEAARLAGVTPRTLRHYHQLGIVDEPAREPNGYREYSIDHVARVIRIRRLADLGVPLERTPALLEGRDGAAGELEQLDAALMDQIALLERRRAELAEIRASRRAPDIAAEVAPYLEALNDGLTAELAALTTHEMVLGFQITPEERWQEYTAVLAPLLEPEVRTRLKGLNTRLSELADDATEEEIAELVDGIVRFNLDDLPRPEIRAQTATEVLAIEAIDAYWASRVRPVQRRVIELAARTVGECLRTTR